MTNPQILGAALLLVLFSVPIVAACRSFGVRGALCIVGATVCVTAAAVVVSVLLIAGFTLLFGVQP